MEPYIQVWIGFSLVVISCIMICVVSLFIYWRANK